MRPALVVLAALVAACAGPPPSAPAEDEAPSADASCEAHGVLQALCTRCNPALVPVFRARGDYCEEHGFPESICPTCHPERGGRPSAPLAIDDAPPDGTRVRLASAELAADVGVRTVPVLAAEGPLEVAATAHIVHDATRVARLNPRSPGVIRTVLVDVGARVEVGDPLVFIASADVASDHARLASASTRLDVAEQNLARREALGDAVSRREVLAAREERDEAAAELAVLRASLRVVGGARSGGEYVLTAPLAGVVTRRSGTIGAFVDAAEVLVEIVDTSRVWLELDVPERESARVREGLPVRAEIEGLGIRLEGELAFLATEVDVRTRTIRARVPVPNESGLLRANMFATARVLVPRDESGWLVPRDAVQHARGADLIFVEISPDLYEARRIEVVEAPDAAETVEVRGRIDRTDRVVVDAAFLLRTETLRDSIGAGCCDGDEAE